MKALVLYSNDQEFRHLATLFRVHFPDINVVPSADLESAINTISCDGALGVVVLDCAVTREKTTDVAMDITDLLGEVPIVFWGHPDEIKGCVSQIFLDSNPLSEFLSKPIDVAAFKTMISEFVDRFKKEEFEQSIVSMSRNDVVATRVKNFYLYKKIPYDAFMEVSQTKFIKSLTKDTPYTHSAIDELIRKKVKYLYLGKDDTLKFLETSVETLHQYFQTVDVDTDIVEVIGRQINAVSIIHQYLRTVGINDSIIQLTHEIINSASLCFLQCRHLNEFLNRFPMKTRDSAELSTMTFYVCMFILAKMGWNSQTSQQKIGLASILHDCTLSNDDMTKVYSLQDPTLKMLTPQEQEEFRIHPIKAAELADHFTGFSEVNFIISQHHELPTRDGFPHGLNSHEITAFSGIFILANNFVSLVAQRGLGRSNLSKMLDIMAQSYGIGNFKQPLQLLRSMVTSGLD